MQKRQEFKWMSECQQAFEELQHRLTFALVIALPDYNLLFRLYTDVSLYGIGAVLVQVREDQEHNIVCASHSLTIPEKNYAPTKQKCLGIIWMLQHVRPYIAEACTTVITNRHSHQMLCKTCTRHAQLIRWCKMFILEVTYRPGKLNTNADAVSQLPSSNPSLDSIHKYYNFLHQHDAQ